jgi:hypothetical protein
MVNKSGGHRFGVMDETCKAQRVVPEGSGHLATVVAVEGLLQALMMEK